MLYRTNNRCTLFEDIKMLYRMFLCLTAMFMVSSGLSLEMNIDDKNLDNQFTDTDLDQPLFLTPYIEDGETKLARVLSRVHDLADWPIESYAGYITVNKATRSNTFFWFFPAENNPESAPVLLWLNGGPGWTSLFGLFVEHGPYAVDVNRQLKRRSYSWTRKYSMLYVDNPVGTGFSFADQEGYAKDETDVARDLYSFLTQFFQVFDMYTENDFYVTGESYAGKYVPAISYKIHVENQSGRSHINFKGMAIGDGFCDPESMMPAYADFLYNIGLVDEVGRDFFQEKGYEISQLIKDERFTEAATLFRELILKGRGSHFYNMTGIQDLYNYLRTEKPEKHYYFLDFLNQRHVRNALHVGDNQVNRPSVVAKYLIKDLMDTIKPWFTEIIEKYKVLVFNGQLDIVISVPMTEAFLMSVPWSGKQAYITAQRQIWKIHKDDTEVSGYAKNVGKFYQVIVRNSGHIVPDDQPERAFDMLQRFIEDRGFES